MVIYAYAESVQEDANADTLQEQVVFHHEVLVSSDCQECPHHFFHVFMDEPGKRLS